MVYNSQVYVITNGIHDAATGGILCTTRIGDIVGALVGSSRRTTPVPVVGIEVGPSISLLGDVGVSAAPVVGIFVGCRLPPPPPNPDVGAASGTETGVVTVVGADIEIGRELTGAATGAKIGGKLGLDASGAKIVGKLGLDAIGAKIGGKVGLDIGVGPSTIPKPCSIRALLPGFHRAYVLASAAWTIRTIQEARSCIVIAARRLWTLAFLFEINESYY